MNVLLSAYACQPGQGSEPGIGWNWVRTLAARHDLWVVTCDIRRPFIEASPEARHPSIRWVYVPLSCAVRPGRAATYHRYLTWQKEAAARAIALHGQIGFDVAHHVTFGNFWTPSLVASLDIPFVWGPVGGGESMPAAFLPSLGLRGLLFELARSAAQQVGSRCPGVRRVARTAAVAVATTPETAVRLTRMGATDVRVMCQVGLAHDDVLPVSSPAPAKTGFRVLSLGRLLPWKGYHLGLRAFQRLAETCPDAEYRIGGEGFDRNRLERLARRLGILPRVRFLGNLPRPAALAEVAAADVFLHPSLHEAAGYACLEAMACGVPVVCLQRGGPGLMVTRDTGIAVSVLSPAQVIRDLAAGLDRLSRDDAGREAMGRLARRRAIDFFAWEDKGRRMDEWYHSIVAGV